MSKGPIAGHKPRGIAVRLAIGWNKSYIWQIANASISANFEILFFSSSISSIHGDLLIN